MPKLDPYPRCPGLNLALRSETELWSVELHVKNALVSAQDSLHVTVRREDDNTAHILYLVGIYGQITSGSDLRPLLSPRSPRTDLHGGPRLKRVCLQEAIILPSRFTFNTPSLLAKLASSTAPRTSQAVPRQDSRYLSGSSSTPLTTRIESESDPK